MNLRTRERTAIAPRKDREWMNELADRNVVAPYGYRPGLKCPDSDPPLRRPRRPPVERSGSNSPSYVRSIHARLPCYPRIACNNGKRWFPTKICLSDGWFKHKIHPLAVFLRWRERASWR